MFDTRMLAPMISSIGLLIVGSALGLWIGDGKMASLLGGAGLVVGGAVGWLLQRYI